jgi:Protein of unknown function (DUF3617)
MRTAPTVLAAVLALAAAGARGEGMMPGRWEITSTITSPAMPGMRPATRTQCFGPQQNWDPASMLDPGRGHPDCELTVTSARPEDFAWTMRCPQSGKRGSGKMRYGATSMRGQLRTSSAVGGQRFDTTQKISARRLGPCRP